MALHCMTCYQDIQFVGLTDVAVSVPSTAGTLIKSLHTKKGEEKARKQLKVLGVTFNVAFLWDLFEWFFSGYVLLNAMLPTSRAYHPNVAFACSVDTSC